MSRFVDVIVPLAVDGMFTYAIPHFLEGQISRGMLVWVAFAGNKKYTALVWKEHDQQPEGYEVKWVEGIAEEQLQLGDMHLRFLMWLSEYYMSAPGEVMKAALPIAFRLESFTTVVRTAEEIDYSGLSVSEKALLGFLQPGEEIALRELEKYLSIKNGMPVVKSLLRRKYIRIKESVEDVFREKTERVVTWARRFNEEELGKLLDGLKRASVQYTILCKWIEAGKEEMSRAEFMELAGHSAAAFRGLCDKGILKVEERKVSRLEDVPTEGGKLNPLTVEQQGALESIRAAFREKDCVLLRGVTSSGKTEVYIHLIEEYISKGYQVLYMLPEIALTVQIVRRLQRVFGDKVGIYHSGMSDLARAEMWKKQCSEHPYPLVLGVRSSVFLPFQKLGLVIVDEEHDGSYKQKEPAPRYQARDAAIMLGKMNAARVLLGSATPSFESYYNASTGKYGLVELMSRYGGVLMPEIRFVDLGEDRRKKKMQGSFSPTLIEEMRKVLEDEKQVILFQNRRGYSSYVQCDRCGSIPKCRHCDVSLTYYKQRHVLVCRYCGAVVQMNEECGDCGHGHYKVRIPGTERIEEEVSQIFPEAKVARMDLDIISSKSRFMRVIDDFEHGRTNILIGTQMVTKGLDFENVKLVGIMDADSMVNFPDFRAEERAFCMFMQVSGRSGRKGERGKVVIQAADLSNRVYHFLHRGDYPAFYEQLAQEREMFVYPPYGKIIQIELRHKEESIVRQASNRLASHLREALGKRVCGPAVPEVSRIGGIYRLVIILKIEHGLSYSAVKKRIREESKALHQEKAYGSVKVFCDVDP